MTDIRSRMSKLMEEQAEEATEAPALKQVADQLVVGLMPMLPEGDDEAVEMLVANLKKLAANKSMLRTALKRMSVGSRAHKAAKALVKSV